MPARHRRADPTADAVAAELLAGLPAGEPCGVWRRSGATVVGAGIDGLVDADGRVALDALDRLGPGTWVGWCSFELGHAVEPVQPRGASREPAALPDTVFARFAAHAVVRPGGRVELRGGGRGRDLLAAAAADLGTGARYGARAHDTEPTGPWRSSLDREGFEARVEAVLELLRAGDCYQVNLTRRLTREGRVDPVALHRRLVECNPAPHAGFLRVELARYGAVAVASAAPERYLRVAGTQVETRPIKGTGVDPAALRASAKDRAENVMIVDLARNDLGRVCVPGSVHVPTLAEVEPHPGLHHLVSTVEGTLRPGVGFGALVAATFPPASVTGAPKPRVLQAIEDLEPVRRGVYCGGFGWVDTGTREADLAVAIRTFAVFDDRAELGVGAGIVADSSPAAEWDETVLKAANLLAAADAGVLVPS